MNEFESKIKIKPLKRNTDKSKFYLYKAALEWSLIDPIVIEKESDLKSKNAWKDKVKPYEHQVKNLITFCRRLPVTLLADDVGLGKTISAGLVMSELMTQNRIEKVLIVCPKLLMEQWQEELQSKFGIQSTIAIGGDLISAEPPDGQGAVITTYTSARIHLEKIIDNGYDMLILDEAHKLRNLYGVDKTPKVAIQFQKALANRMFRYVLMLTATPIQNRLWDMYSLVDLLSTARGHENPFGSSGLFYRKFVDDSRDQARKLKPEAKEDFRDIVYSYMSRIRRADADLQFPDRIVERYIVDPTNEELELLKVVSESIEDLNRLAQIGILKASVSSPEALLSWMNSMVRNGTIDAQVRDSIDEIVKRIPITAKMGGLGALVERLRSEKPQDWRMVIFTCSRETQTSIQLFLEEKGIKCSLINGDTTSKNSETISSFKNEPPEINVIISTEAGSEGVNLQASNVLVNYDLPWNPMIVEQRIGRVQRLASKHANVSIFNMTLKGTFEEYIVNRLMEKLQMASQAIGDIEALLEASGIDENSDEKAEKFEDKILKLVLASLKGIDVEDAAKREEKSIESAKKKLEEEEANIEHLLGETTEYNGPQSPNLPEISRSMDLETFIIKSFESFGLSLTESDNGILTFEKDGKTEIVELNTAGPKRAVFSTLYRPGAGAFDRLVKSMTNDGMFILEDLDVEPEDIAKNLAENWTSDFKGTLKLSELKSVKNIFAGTALVYVKVTVAHDSYERLVEVDCSPDSHFTTANSLDHFDRDFLNDPSDAGINLNQIAQEILLDPGVAEFCRFYEERRKHEIKSAGSDERKRKKLEDDFTPRVSATLVALEGSVCRELELECVYELESGVEYKSSLGVLPSRGSISAQPDMGVCQITGMNLPLTCLGTCEISGKFALSDKLQSSEESGRKALPEYFATCSYTQKKVLKDEVQESDVTGKSVLISVMKKSDVSGRWAEPIYIGTCDFSNSEALKAELCVSDVSGKNYRMDEKLTSSVSGKAGHKSEFIKCSQTGKPLISEEAEICEVTGAIVAPGILETCIVTSQKVLPSELLTSTFSEKRALKKFFVKSSISESLILEEEAIKSDEGKFCSPLESKVCVWSGFQCHPDDIRVCRLLNIELHFKYLDESGNMKILKRLLDGTLVGGSHFELEENVCKKVCLLTAYKKAQILSSERSASGHHYVLCVEIKAFLGIKTRYIGLMYSTKDNGIVGQLCLGKRDKTHWIFESIIQNS
ncbi:MAG: SNF2-related protein [Patescibacteria group bacterium]